MNKYQNIPSEGLNVSLWMSGVSFKATPIWYLSKDNVFCLLKVYEDKIQYRKNFRILESKYDDIQEVDGRLGSYLLGKQGIEKSLQLVIKFKHSIFAYLCILSTPETSQKEEIQNGIDLLKLFQRKGVLLSNRAEKMLNMTVE